MASYEYISGGAPRATRFVMQLPARCRCDTSDTWHSATTINVSRSGILFKTSEAIESGTLLDVSLLLVPARGQGSGRIHCCCRVVRVQPGPDDDSGTMIAAVIIRYTFQHDGPWSAILVSEP